MRVANAEPAAGHNSNHSSERAEFGVNMKHGMKYENFRRRDARAPMSFAPKFQRLLRASNAQTCMYIEKTCVMLVIAAKYGHENVCVSVRKKNYFFYLTFIKKI